MKNYVKITMRGKKIIHMPIDKWQSIVNDPSNLVAYKPEGQDEWTGETLNKMEVIFSELDKEYTQKANKPKIQLYRNKETNTVLRVLEGQLPDDPTKYELM
jgi:hypothetical protein